MSLANFLLAELTNLCTESRKRSPEVRESSETLLEFIKQWKRSSRSSPDPRIDDVELSKELKNIGEKSIHPFLLAFSSKNVKLVQLSISCIQRLILHKGLDNLYASNLLSAFSDILDLGLDVQLKILQTILPLLMNLDEIDLEVVSMSFYLSFKLRTIKNPIVINTASATIRQIYSYIYDKAKMEVSINSIDENEEYIKEATIELNSLAHKSMEEITKDMKPAVLCAYIMSRDLYLVSNGEEAKYLDYNIDREFCLEIIESGLSQNQILFKSCLPLLFLVKELVCPFLIKLFSEKLNFIYSCRLVKLIKTLFEDYHPYIVMESEIFLSILCKLLESKETIIWYRALILECFREITIKSKFIFHNYDQGDNAIILACEIINTFKNVILSENGTLLLTGSNNNGSATPQTPNTQISSSFLDTYGLMTIANAVTSTSSSIIETSPIKSQSEYSFNYSTSGLRIPLLDSLKKEDPPVVLNNYLIRLCLDCIVNIVKCEKEFSQKPKLKDILINVVQRTNKSILTALSFLLKASIDDDTFQIVLNTYQDMVFILGILNLNEERNDFLRPLCNLCLPSNVGSSDIIAPVTYMEKLFLNERNLTCLKCLIGICHSLSNMLDSNAWFIILKTIQSADQLIMSGRTDTSTGKNDTKSKTNDDKIENEYLKWVAETKLLFNNSQKMTSKQLNEFLIAFCKLSKERIDILESKTKINPNDPTKGQNIKESAFALDRLSELVSLNIQTLVTEKSFEGWNMVVNELIDICHSEYASTITSMRSAELLGLIIVESCKTLRTILPKDFNDSIFMEALIRLADIDSTEKADKSEKESSKLRRANKTSELRKIDLQKTVLDTIDKVLQTSGNDLRGSWNVIFNLLRSIILDLDLIKPSDNPPIDNNKHDQLTNNMSNKYGLLIRSAFPCLQLICSDFLSLLSINMLKQCVGLVGLFATQKEDMNISLSAIQLLWKLSDFVLKKMKSTTDSEINIGANDESVKDIDILWMNLLEELSLHCSDRRPEVRNSAHQTLFRTMSLNGKRFKLNSWNECIWNVIFPLLEKVSNFSNTQTIMDLRKSGYQSLVIGESNEMDLSSSGEPYSDKNVARQWDETKIITIKGVMKTFIDFLPILSLLEDKFDRAFITLIDFLQKFILSSPNEVAIIALSYYLALVDLFISMDAQEPKDEKELALKNKIPVLVNSLWDSWVKLGELLVGKIESFDSDAVYTKNPAAVYGRLSRTIPIIYGQFGQDFLIKYVDILENMMKLNFFINELNVIHLQSLLSILSGILRYFTIPKSRSSISDMRYDYPVDTENLTPLQSKVFNLIIDPKLINLSYKNYEQNKNGNQILKLAVPSKELILSSLALFILYPFISPRYLRNTEQFVVNTSMHRIVQLLKVSDFKNDAIDNEFISKYNDITSRGFVNLDFKVLDLPKISVRRSDLFHKGMIDIVNKSNEIGFTYLAFSKKCIEQIEIFFNDDSYNCKELFTMGAFSDVISSLGLCMTANYHFDPKLSLAKNLLRHSTSQAKALKFLSDESYVSLSNAAVHTCIGVVKNGLSRFNEISVDLPRDIIFSIFSSILTVFSDYFISRHNMLCIGSRTYDILLNFVKDIFFSNEKENIVQNDVVDKLSEILRKEQDLDCYISSRFVDEIVPILSAMPLELNVLSQIGYIISDNSSFYIKKSDIYALKVYGIYDRENKTKDNDLENKGIENKQSHEYENISILSKSSFNTIDDVLPLIKEKFARHNLKLLFILCSKQYVGNDNVRTKIGELIWPILLERCKKIISRYAENKIINGKVPLNSAIVKEVYIVLYLLENIELSPSCLPKKNNNVLSNTGLENDRYISPSLLVKLYPQILNLLSVLVDPLQTHQNRIYSIHNDLIEQDTKNSNNVYNSIHEIAQLIKINDNSNNNYDYELKSSGFNNIQLTSSSLSLDNSEIQIFDLTYKCLNKINEFLALF